MCLTDKIREITDKKILSKNFSEKTKHKYKELETCKFLVTYIISVSESLGSL